MKRHVFGMVTAALLALAPAALAEEAGLLIRDMQAEPQAARAGARALISCRVTHAQGSAHIDRVAATAHGSERVTGYTRLFDDGTHGDRAPGDGVYSLEIQLLGPAGEQKVVFQAMDTAGLEVESEPIALVVR
jgi:hypothetical protein